MRGHCKIVYMNNPHSFKEVRENIRKKKRANISRLDPRRVSKHFFGRCEACSEAVGRHLKTVLWKEVSLNAGEKQTYQLPADVDFQCENAPVSDALLRDTIRGRPILCRFQMLPLLSCIPYQPNLYLLQRQSYHCKVSHSTVSLSHSHQMFFFVFC